MIKPEDIESEDVWDTLVAAESGDVPALRRLIERDATLVSAGYFYTPAIHFAVREGHLDAVRLLLDAGADPEWNGLHEGSLIEMARERDYVQIAERLEQDRDRRGRVLSQPVDHPIHAAAQRRDPGDVRAQLDA